MLHYVWVKNSLWILDGYWAVWIILNGEMRTTTIYWHQSGFQSETDSQPQQTGSLGTPLHATDTAVCHKNVDILSRITT